MNDHKGMDDRIRRLVRSVDRDIPSGLERRIHGMAPAPETLGGKKSGLSQVWISIPACLAALLLGILILSSAFRGRPAPLVTEIRTDFEISDKNITIIFIQKSDFPPLKEILP